MPLSPCVSPGPSLAGWEGLCIALSKPGKKPKQLIDFKLSNSCNAWCWSGVATLTSLDSVTKTSLPRFWQLMQPLPLLRFHKVCLLSVPLKIPWRRELLEDLIYRVVGFASIPLLWMDKSLFQQWWFCKVLANAVNSLDGCVPQPTTRHTSMLLC